ncbi:MAG: type II toxin-antitoxin system HicA family toxin [Terrimicrobiaceae bacterium]|nr:type II toxin-antitoxin system HicA family toxin [Terrimicrobiaceae bacterium]
MRIPRDVSGAQLVKALRALGYAVARQDGSHIRLTTTQNGQHHVTVPNHSPVKPGTLGGILKAVALHHRLTVEELLRKLDL